MKYTKLSPADRKRVIERVKAGEKQKDVAADFGITPSYVSKIMKEETGATPRKIKRFRDLSQRTNEQLQNRYVECFKEIKEHMSVLHQNRAETKVLERRIYEDTERLKTAGDVLRLGIQKAIVAHRAQVSGLSDERSHTSVVAILLQEATDIMIEMSKRPDSECPILFI